MEIMERKSWAARGQTGQILSADWTKECTRGTQGADQERSDKFWGAAQGEAQSRTDQTSGAVWERTAWERGASWDRTDWVCVAAWEQTDCTRGTAWERTNKWYLVVLQMEQEKLQQTRT